MLIDTHAHLYYDSFNPDFEEVIKRAKDANLKAIVNIGADIEGSKKAVELESNQIKLYSSIGLHPHEASKLSDIESIHPNITGELEEIYHSSTGKIVAIGECGLDYFRVFEESRFPSEARGSYYFQGLDYSPSSLSENQQKSLQKQLFLDQIGLAKKLGLPLIIHCRDAWQDIFLPELTGATGVFHSFTATETEAKKALDLGFYLGFSCIITYPKNEHLRQIIKWMPLDKILTETDCPFLPPQTQRGQRNEPANVAEVIKVIAGIKGLSEKQVSQAIWQNATQLFKFTV